MGENKLMKNGACLEIWTMIVLVLTALPSLAQSVYESYTFTTVAGNAGYGNTDGMGTAARFWHPNGVAVDNDGNVYVTDTSNYTIRKVTPAGVVTTLAGLAGFSGSVDGTANDARFNNLSGVAVDSIGNIYVADNHTIRKITPTGVVTTLAGLAGSPGSADDMGSAARFNNPSGVAVDSAGNVYVADSVNNTIRKVTAVGMVTTLAGNPTITNEFGLPAGGYTNAAGSDARFKGPRGVAVDRAGNVYVADTYNHTIRKVTPAGVVTTLSGLAGNAGGADGTSAAQFNYPSGLAADTTGNVYVADRDNHTIRKVTPAGMVTTLAGLADFFNPGSTDGTGNAARFYYPTGVAVDTAGNVYVADSANNTIRIVTQTRAVTTLAGLAGSFGSVDGTGSAARFFEPTGVTADSAGNVYVVDTSNYTIRKVTPTGVVTTLAGLAHSGFGSADGTGSSARFFDPYGVAMDNSGNLYVADTGNGTIRKVTLEGVVTTLAGRAGYGGSADGTGSEARFAQPSGVAVDSAGNVYVTDRGHYMIRKVTPEGVVTTLAGLMGRYGSADGAGSAARFFVPYGVAVDSAGNVYVGDTGNSTIRKVTPAGVVTTLAGLAGAFGSADGTGSAARFSSPQGVAVDSAGNVYVADHGNHTIRKVTPAGVVTTLAGLAGSLGSADGTGRSAQFYGPWGVAVDSAGSVYVADYRNNTIRKGYPEQVPLFIVASGPGFDFINGEFGFNLTGPTGRLVVVEASSDLMSWLPLWTNNFASALNFVDPQSSVYSNRFYRAFIR
jgi:sugar lactone lactonase YvrE